MSDFECVFVISVCDPVLGDHGSMVRLVAILLLDRFLTRVFVPLMCVGGF